MRDGVHVLLQVSDSNIGADGVLGLALLPHLLVSMASNSSSVGLTSKALMNFEKPIVTNGTSKQLWSEKEKSDDRLDARSS